MDEPKTKYGELPYGHFFSTLGGKWKPYILVAINSQGSIRFNEIMKKWGISSKMLYQHLRELEADGFIHRIVDCDEKQKVEYILTKKGEKAIPLIKQIYKWAIDDMIEKDILIDSRAFDYYKKKP